ncbi:leucine-rich repeat extensin-like protein 6 [Phoenix dactylifera]|uniref:Leucine-rich repeat extensin-like protein 6 n=1 Tax=Phoenix dactylifera TaxID=42345 RepID=A0A8B7BSE8_PHODC|nr:leucine-rich repeat extensin-like protein 6 [Phoenix dactylifera]XP_038980434.1 leucine-rich repeat extensin-like protein 6 [Phoenix dactylifera]
MGSGCGHHSPISIILSLSEKGTRVPFPLMANRLAASFPLALLLLLALSSPPIASAKPVIKDDVSCTMCSSCDNPCQPAASPPPPPPSSTAECPPPPSNPGAISYYSPPPPDVYSSPPPPSNSGGGGSGGGGAYYYPPPPNRYYPAPPPPNPFLPYFPFYYYNPPPNKYHSGSLSLKPLSTIPLLLLLLLFF